ncbi:MAG TPA: PEP-CTERM sorting domain-containing protein [Verrucomicrobiae bacterium]
MKASQTMRPFISTITASVALLLGIQHNVHGQGTLHAAFDGPPTLPPGSAAGSANYVEPGQGVDVNARGGGFTRRWSGDPMFPDNWTAYIQPGQSQLLFFTYMGAGHPFAAVSVDLALHSASSLEPVTVQFTASGYSGGIIATTAFTVAGTVDSQGQPAFQTFYFPPQFHDMYYLRLTPATSLWSLDNLVIYVPEPSALALLVVGSSLLWAARRRCIHTGLEPREKHDTIH